MPICKADKVYKVGLDTCTTVHTYDGARRAWWDLKIYLDAVECYTYQTTPSIFGAVILHVSEDIMAPFGIGTLVWRRTRSVLVQIHIKAADHLESRLLVYPPRWL